MSLSGVELRIGRAPAPPPPPWQPSDLASCLLWVQADDLPLGSVTTWPNRISGGQSLAQANASNQPSNQSSIIGSQPAVYFAADDYLAADSGAITSALSGTDMPWTVVLAVRTASTLSAYQCWVSSGRSSSSTPYRLMAYHNGSGYSLLSYIRDDASLAKTIQWAGNIIQPSTNYVLAYVCTGTQISIYRNSLGVGYGPADADVATCTQDLFTVGSGRRQTSLLYPLTGWIGYVCLYSSALSGSDLSNAIQHAATWGGISLA